MKNDLRRSCRKTKTEPKACMNYSYSLQRCVLGLVPYTCPRHIKSKENSKQAKQVRAFYAI